MDMVERKRRRSGAVLVHSKKLKKSSLQGRRSVAVKDTDNLIEEGELDLDLSENDEELVQADDGVSGGVEVYESEESDGHVGEVVCEAVNDSRERKVRSGGCQNLFKPPTHEELQTLRETQNLFKSNLMKLQITELLGEVKVKTMTPRSRRLEAFLQDLKETLLSIPSSSQINLSDGLDHLKKVKYPLSFTPTHSNGKFKFGPPSGVRLVGSYLVGTSIKSNLIVDLELSLPMDCLQVKDIFDYRYFFKRALYLSMLASHLRKKKGTLHIKSIKFQLFQENPLLPILVLTPEGKHLSRDTIQVHTSILNHTYFKLSKLIPGRNNVRLSFLGASSTTAEEQVGVGPATPHYNAHILMELGARERHLKDIFTATQDCPGLADAVILYKVWARQRGLDKGYGGFTGFHFSLLGSSLLLQKKINMLMSCYQIFRVLMLQLTSSDWTTAGFFSTPLSSSPSHDAFHSAYDVVFVDSSGMLNVCADMSKERYRWLQHEAAIALRLLDDSTPHGFKALFMRPVPLEHKLDVLYHIPLSLLSLPSINLDDSSKESISLDAFAWPLPHILSRVLSVIYRGLDRRVKLVVPFFQVSRIETPWLSTKTFPDLSSGYVIIGLLLDTDHAFSVLNMGPAADIKEEAAEFRSFWGERSEMRRFQDGSIKEAVVWGDGGECIEERRDICQRIITYLLRRHFSVTVEGEGSSNGMLDVLLRCTSSGAKVKGSEVCMQNVHDTFTELSRELRRLKELPLSVSSLQATSPTFRYTEVLPLPAWNGRPSSSMQAASQDDSYQSNCYYPLCDTATPSLVPAHPVVCQLESSGKWPEEVDAIRKVKVAFYIHMAKTLEEHSGLVASPTNTYLDILKNGYLFRLQLYHHHELILLREKVQKSSNNASLSSMTSAQIKEDATRIHREMVALPVLTSTLNGLHQQFLMYGRGARLCKRWVSSHLMSNHITDEAIELIVAYLFVHPAPFTIPSSDLVVFLRFLSLLSTYEWHLEPLIVNFNNELSATKISELMSEFSKNRSTLPPLVVLTPHDLCPSTWSSVTLPSAPVFDRLIRLARETLEELSKLVREGWTETDDIRRMFRTPLDDFDVLIHLHRRHLPRSHQAVDGMVTGCSHRMLNGCGRCTHLPVVDFDPAQIYLKELESAFSDFALFFHDKYGGSFIAVVWKPGVFSSLCFKVLKAHCRVPVRGSSKVKSHGREGEVVADLDAIICDFQLLGEGLVKTVEVRQRKQ